MRYGILVLFFSIQCLAGTDWLCTEEASQRKGNNIYACGVGSGSDENEARSKAFANAKNEFKQVCESSDDCRGHRISASPERTACESADGAVKCYRLIVFTIGQLGNSGRSAISGYSDNHETFVPFEYGSIARYPKVRVGMKKAEVLTLFGEPKSVQEIDEQVVFDYWGPMCRTYPGTATCSVWFNKHTGKVLRFNNFQHRYTEYLK